jgi:hypothetical protein
MTGIRRRRVLQGVAAAGFATASGPIPAAPPVAGAPAPLDGEPIAQVVRDATMIWTELPLDWRDAPFLGNGRTTAQVMGGAAGAGLIFAVSAAGRDLDAPLGRIELSLKGTPTHVRWELDLWNGELRAAVTTTRGMLTLSALVHHEHGVLLVSLTPSSGERNPRWRLAADTAAGELVWHERRSPGPRMLAMAPAGTNLEPVLSGDPPALLAGHRRWWHDYHSRSMASVPHKSLQRFHCTQLYLAAALQRRDTDGAMAASALFATTDRLAYHPATAAIEEGRWPQSTRHLMVGLPGTGLKSGHTPGPVLAWNLPELWRHHRHSGDDRALDLLHAMLREAVGFYEEHLVEGPGRRLHLPTTYSPEYAEVADSTYHLAQLRWALNRLISTAEARGDARRHRWRELAERVVAYHSDESGVLIGAGVRLARSHRHPSHLLWLDHLAAGSADRTLMRQSLDHWSSRREAWDVGSYVAAAQFEIALRAPARALARLDAAMGEAGFGDSRMLSTALIRTGKSADLATSLRAAHVLPAMMASTSGDGLTEVFAAAPSSWKDISVVGLRLPGGCLLDASRRDGRVEWVRLRSDAARTVLLRHGIPGSITATRDARTAPAVSNAAGITKVTIAAGESIVLSAGAATAAETAARDVPAAGVGRRWGFTGRTAAYL